MDLNELALKLKTLEDPSDLFGTNPEATLREYRKICHPDLFEAGSPKAELAKQIFQEIDNQFLLLNTALPIIKGKKRSYKIIRNMALGDISDVYLAEGQDKDAQKYILKVSRVQNSEALIEHEFKTLQDLFQHAGENVYKNYLPLPVETFPVRDKFKKQINVFAYGPRFFTLTKVRENHYPQGLPPRHLVWVINRMLVATGFANRCGWIHGGITPDHMMINPELHHLKIVGWIHATPEGQQVKTMSSKFKDYYAPEILKKQPVYSCTDIYMIGKTAIYLAGGDVKTDQIPDTVPVRLQGFLRACVLESPAQRPVDAWDLFDEFKKLQKEVYGKAKFVELVLK